MDLKVFILNSVMCGLVLSSCASSEEPISRAHPATITMDSFQIEQGMPIREVKKHQFYFKKCELDTRHAFTSKAEYFCNER